MFESNKPESMHTSESVSELDKLIRSSLASYGEPSPDSELPRRILSRIAAEPRPMVSYRWLPWAVAMPIAACLIAAFLQFEIRPVYAPSSLADQPHVTAPLPNNTSANAALLTPHPPERRTRLTRNGAQRQLTAVAKAQPIPKLDVFPTPQPLTPSEQALLQFAAGTPAAELKSLIEAQQQPITPLNIAALTIQPIKVPELGTN